MTTAIEVGRAKFIENQIFYRSKKGYNNNGLDFAGQKKLMGFLNFNNENSFVFKDI